MTRKTENASSQANLKAGKGGVIPPVDKRFGQPNGNPINRAGTPKYIRELREELKPLLDPNLSVEDIEKIVKKSKTDSALRGVFGLAILKRDYKVIFEMMNQAWGAPKQTIEAKVEQTNPYAELSVEELRKLAGK